MQTETKLELDTAFKRREFIKAFPTFKIPFFKIYDKKGTNFQDIMALPEYL
jgi:hypothetical protein